MKKRSDKTPAPFFNIGASSLLVIFLILCLVTFAILTLTSARSDEQFARRLADHKSDYYTACNTAETYLDAIDERIETAWQTADSKAKDSSGNGRTTAKKPVFAEITSNLAEWSEQTDVPLTMNFDTEAPTVAFQVAIDDQQNLCVTLTLSPTVAPGDTYYHISQWQIVSSGEWNGDQTLNLMK